MPTWSSRKPWSTEKTTTSVRSMPRQPVLDCAVIGAGPAGLAMSAALADRGVDHVVLDRGRPGETWRTQRWDSFRLNTPGWMNQMLGEQADGAFAAGAEVVQRLEALAAQHPVRPGVAVTRLAPNSDGFIAQASDELLRTRTVVVATGDQNVPRVPPLARTLPEEIAQQHTADYRGPGALPPGGVLVVGSGQSGCQITEDLLAADRRVVLATSPAGRLPWRHRGRELLAWLVDAGFWDQRPQDLPDPSMIRAAQPIVASGGRSLSLQSLARAGATLVGRPLLLKDGTLAFDDSVNANIAAGDAFAARVRTLAEKFIQQHGLDAPTSEPDDTDTPVDLDPLPALNLREADIKSVVWCTGFTGDFSWLTSELRGADGQPQRDGASGPVPGLWYVGLRWLTRRRSAILFGFPRDAETIADAVKAHLGGAGHHP
jgi:putative flavoprotein involved in K+ transport